MSDVLHLVGVFFSYAVLAIFAQNAVFTRSLGVSRLVQLVGDERTSSWWFALMLCITQVLVAPLAYFAGSFIAPLPNRAQLQRLIHALGLNARQAEHLTTQYDELRSGAQAHRTDEALYELLQTAMRSRDNLMNDVLAPMPRSEADLEAAFTSR